MTKIGPKAKLAGKPEPLQVYVKKLVNQLGGGKDSGVHLSAAALRGVAALGRELMRRNAELSYDIALANGQKTISSKHTRAAGRLRTFGTVAVHANSEATKAVAKFKQH